MSFLQRISHRSRRISADPSCLNRPRIRRRFLLIVFVSGLFTASAAYAFAPAVIWIGRTLATVALESIVIEGVTRGFAANDPYVKNRITVPVSNLGKTFKSKRSWLNPYWAAFATAAGLMFYDNETGFAVQQPVKGYVNIPGQAVSDSGWHAYWIGDISGFVKTSFAASGKDQTFISSTPEFQSATMTLTDRKLTVAATPTRVYWKYYEYERWNYREDLVWRSTDPIDLGSEQKPVTEAQVSAMAAAYLASDNRPDAAFMDTAGKPIPELLENAVIEPVPNVDADTLTDLAAYRAGLLQTTDPTAEHYVTPERYEELKKLAAQQDYANSPEGELDALNEKMKQPITQAQYEESNAKADVATQRALVPVTGLEQLTAPFEQYQADVTQTPNQSINSMPLFGFPRFGGGSCSVISLNFSIMGETFDSDTSAVCGFYYEYLLPAFTALFYILTGFVIWLDVREAISRRV